MFYKFAAVLTTLLEWSGIFSSCTHSPNFPEGYFVDGDYRGHCVVIKDEKDGRLKHCEHMASWDHLDEEDHVANRFILLLPGEENGTPSWGP